MRGQTKSLIFIGVVLFVLFFVHIFSVDYQREECIENGGKWMSRIVAGNYSYSCVPK